MWRGYLVFCCAVVGWMAGRFYGYMHFQTGGIWSAPLDDVFIHFDYARAAARGFPMQWSEGNGYSSGNTSLLYPWVLAAGYRLGLQGLHLMFWAAVVAVGSTVGFLAALGWWLDRKEAPWAKFLLPPAVMSLGALDWSLFSGMENAMHLGVWALATLAMVRLDTRPTRANAALLGGAGVLLCYTRPESIVLLLVMTAASAIRGPTALRRTVVVWGLGAPVGALVLHAIVNRLLTGESSAAGAIVKLAIHHPYFTWENKWQEYVFHLKYVFFRLTEHHFADKVPWGYLVLALALTPLVVGAWKRESLILWAQIVGWVLLVALNGQVRWQNERYVMSAAAWIMVLVGLGLASIAGALPGFSARWRGARVSLATLLAGTYVFHQAPNLRDQIWFFGRASRNILDQHIVAGKIIESIRPRRVLVGDAGALMYASDRPGLDIIGLGGYHDYPFARANTHGLGATLELIERMPEVDRPDLMAIYPSWWGDLPVWFGSVLTEVPVFGNVICGGASKVLYRADWSALRRGGEPTVVDPAELIVDELDVADLISERAHNYEFPHPAMGYIEHRVLPEPGQPRHDLFDAGRLIPAGQHERFRLRTDGAPGTLRFRTTADKPVRLRVRYGEAEGVEHVVPGAPGWQEFSLPPITPSAEHVDVDIEVMEGTWAHHHVWWTRPGP